MGVTAINATLNIQSISNNVLQQQIDSRDNPYVTPQNLSYDKPAVEWSDEVIADLERSVPGIASISQVKQLFAIQQAQYLGKTAADILAFAISANYQQTTGRQVLQGRFFRASRL